MVEHVLVPVLYMCMHVACMCCHVYVHAVCMHISDVHACTCAGTCAGVHVVPVLYVHMHVRTCCMYTHTCDDVHVVHMWCTCGVCMCW